MKSKKKIRVNRYRLGTQQVAVPDKGSLDDITSPAISMASTGGALGGPIGAGVGLAVGLGKGISDYAQSNRVNRLMTDQNKYIQRNDLVEDPMLMQQQFKKGTKGVKTRYGKYPDGTKAIKSLGPEFDKIEAKMNTFHPRKYDYASPEADSLHKYTQQYIDLLNSTYGIQQPVVGKSAVARTTTNINPLLAQYELGTQGTDSKPIEVEKNELIFKKSGNRYILKADFKDGKTHNQGGEKYVASEGDIIFPGKDRKKVLNAYKRGDTSTLESFRMNLPKDVKKADDGFDNTGNPFIQPRMGFDQPYGFGPMGNNPNNPSFDPSFGLNFQYTNPTNTISNSTIPTIQPKNPTMNFSNSRTPITLPINQGSQIYAGTDLQDAQNTKQNNNNDFNNILGTGLELAPILYNTARGLSKPSKIQRNYFNPERYQYNDISSPARRAAQEAQNVDKYNINTTRGSRGQIQSYLQNASNNKYKRLADIGNFEGGRKMDIVNRNTEQDNQAKLTNLQLSNQYNDVDAQNRAKRNDFLAASTGQVSQFAQNRKLMSNQAKRDQALIAMDKNRLGLYNQMFPDYGIDYNKDNMELKGIRYKTKQYKKGTRKINRY